MVSKDHFQMIVQKIVLKKRRQSSKMGLRDFE